MVVEIEIEFDVGMLGVEVVDCWSKMMVVEV